RVVRIAGGTEKCNWLTQELGFDAAIDYKRPDWRDVLVKATPDGVHVNFENAGGEIMDGDAAYDAGRRHAVVRADLGLQRGHRSRRRLLPDPNAAAQRSRLHRP